MGLNFFQGVVVKYDAQKGFGFVAADGFDGDIHVSKELLAGTPHRFLVAGTKLEFAAKRTAKGFQAIGLRSIQPPENTPGGQPIELAVTVKRLRVNTSISFEALPLDLVVSEPGPQPDVILKLRGPDGLDLLARVKGKTFRRTMRQAADAGFAGVAVLAGELRNNSTLEEVGFSFAENAKRDAPPNVAATESA